MASLNYGALVPILLLIISYPSTIIAKNQSFSSSPNPKSCASTFLSLAPCGPFVQGTAESPEQQCCRNLKQLHSHESHCLCFLLMDTILGEGFPLNMKSLYVIDTIYGNFPINKTLALQLPTLCELQEIFPTCSGERIQFKLPTSGGTTPEIVIKFLKGAMGSEGATSTEGTCTGSGTGGWQDHEREKYGQHQEKVFQNLREKVKKKLEGDHDHH